MAKVVMMEERYKKLEELGRGNTGVVMLMKDKMTNDLVAVKLIKRGETINESVEREVVNHRSLRHENVIEFKEVMLTPTHLAIVMEYAAGGELYNRTDEKGYFNEDEARYFFRQIIMGIGYCHSKEICHRDLKLDNVLLDQSPNPCLKICDFSFSKCGLLHPRPKSFVGTPPYIAPEVFLGVEYDGKMADIWSCGVMLYVMLVGTYPFEDPEDRLNIHKLVQRVRNAEYTVPDDNNISAECTDLLSRVFVTDPSKRITIGEVKSHPWFVKDRLKVSAAEGLVDPSRDEPCLQSIEEIMQIIQEARTLGNISNVKGAEEKVKKDPDRAAKIDAGKNASTWKEGFANVRRTRNRERVRSLS